MLLFFIPCKWTLSAFSTLCNRWQSLWTYIAKFIQWKKLDTWCTSIFLWCALVHSHNADERNLSFLLHSLSILLPFECTWDLLFLLLPTSYSWSWWTIYVSTGRAWSWGRCRGVGLDIDASVACPIIPVLDVLATVCPLAPWKLVRLPVNKRKPCCYCPKL